MQACASTLWCCRATIQCFGNPGYVNVVPNFEHLRSKECVEKKTCVLAMAKDIKHIYGTLHNGGSGHNFFR
jgi:hypothetical protein